MLARSRDVDNALLEWASSFTKSTINTLAELSDGAIFLKILARLSPQYAADVVLEKAAPSSKWVVKKKNLEAIHKSLVRYMTKEIECPSTALREPVDFNALAQHNDEGQTIKLLSIFLLAAVHTSDKIGEYVDEIKALSAPVQSKIAEVIQTLSGDEQSTLPTDGDGGLPPNSSKDFDLALEQEYAELTKQNEILKAKWADERTRNERLLMRSEEQLEEIRRRDAELEKYEKLSNGGDTGYLDSLAHRIEEQENLIARHEADAEVNRVNNERHEKELAHLRPLALLVGELTDKVKDLESDNSELIKTANKVGKYEEKLKRVNILEKENKQLRDYNSTLENNQVTFDQTQALNERLEQENGNFRRKMETYEAEIFELQGLKQHFEHECRAKDTAIELLEAKKANDEQYIADLHEQINANIGPTRSPGSPLATTGGLNLGAELERSEGHPNYILEISRLKAEIQLLKTNTAGTTNATLRADLENSQRLVERLQTQVHELTELHAIGQEQLGALISEVSGEKLVKLTDRLISIGALQLLTPGFYRNEAIASSRRRYLEANQKLSEANKQVTDLQRELADRDRQLLAAKADLNAMDKEDIDALDELKSANETIVNSLKSDLLALQGQYDALDADYHQQKTQLVDALLKKDKAIEDLANAKDILNVNDEVLWSKQKAEQKLRDERESSLNEQITKQELVIQDLKQQLKIAAENSPDAQKAKYEVVIKNLMRENALITTAWYDLTSRIQSNNVVIQRRQDAPKGWLNRQRQMVNATPRR